MNKVSEELKEDLNLYSIMRKRFLAVFPKCKASLNRCQFHASQVHHKKGRGKYLLVLETWLPVCPSCHHWIELHPKRAKELRFSLDRLTDDVDLIGYEEIINIK